MGCIEHAVVVSIAVFPMSTSEGVDRCTLREWNEEKEGGKGKRERKLYVCQEKNA